ncbi:MAG: PIN domain-containing protein [Egibacteraceae bacterium]
MARSRTRTTPAVEHILILDSGAVIAVARGDQRARAFLERAYDLGVQVEVPVVVVAETVRTPGPRSAPVNRVLRKVRIPAATEELGRIAGSLLAAASSAATVDALVVAQAVAAGGADVLTSDPGDLTALAQNSPEVVIQSL